MEWNQNWTCNFFKFVSSIASEYFMQIIWSQICLLWLIKREHRHELFSNCCLHLIIWQIFWAREYENTATFVLKNVSLHYVKHSFYSTNKTSSPFYSVNEIHEYCFAVRISNSFAELITAGIFRKRIIIITHLIYGKLDVFNNCSFTMWLDYI